MVKRMGLGSILATVAQLSLLIISGIGSLRKFTGSHSQCAFSWNYTSDTSVELGTDGAGYAYTDGGGYVYSPVSEYYMLIPLVFVTVAEVFINITSKHIASQNFFSLIGEVGGKLRIAMEKPLAVLVHFLVRV